MEPFRELINRLELTDDNRLVLDTVPMVLMPRWFFVGILKRVVAEAGADTAARIYYQAGFEGAYNWSKVQIDKGMKGAAVMEQYLGSMTSRGWGRFEIVSLDAANGRGVFRLHNSALALELGRTEAAGCLWVPGALAGSMQVISGLKDDSLKIGGREVQCLASGASYCEYIVEPDPPEAGN